MFIFKLTRCIGTPVAWAYRFTLKANKISHSMVFLSSPVAQVYLFKIGSNPQKVGLVRGEVRGIWLQVTGFLLYRIIESQIHNFFPWIPQPHKHFFNREERAIVYDVRQNHQFCTWPFLHLQWCFTSHFTFNVFASASDYSFKCKKIKYVQI